MPKEAPAHVRTSAALALRALWIYRSGQEDSKCVNLSPKTMRQSFTQPYFSDTSTKREKNGKCINLQTAETSSQGCVDIHCSNTDIYLFFIYIFQSLFNLLEFQRLVLHYSPPARMQDLPRNQKVRLLPDTHVHRG